MASRNIFVLVFVCATVVNAGHYFPGLLYGERASLTQTGHVDRRMGQPVFANKMYFDVTLEDGRVYPLKLKINEKQHLYNNVRLFTKDGMVKYRSAKPKDHRYYQSDDENYEAAVMVSRRHGNFMAVGSFSHDGKEYFLDTNDRFDAKNGYGQVVYPKRKGNDGGKRPGNDTVDGVIDDVPLNKTRQEFKIDLEHKRSRNENIAEIEELESLLAEVLGYKKKPRIKRSTVTSYTVELEMVIANDIYQYWLDKLGSETDAIDTINEYFGQVANNMDLRFSSVSRTNEISIDIVPYTITIDQTGNTWVTDYPVSGTDYYNAENALYAFYEWGLTNIDNNCDSIMLFTMYNLGHGSDDSLVGLAQAYSYTDGTSINAMCFNGDYGVLSVSIVEDLRQGDTSSTAAHELAHTMGVQHDEDSSGDCVYDNEYIMSPNRSVASTDDDSLAANPWKFSSCSIQEIIDNTDSDFNACLQENTYDTNNYADVQAGSTLGELYNRDKQCQLIHGSASSYCTGTGITVSEICQRGLPCVNPDDSSSCPIIEPFHGTKCGKNKRCYMGECVSQSNYFK